MLTLLAYIAGMLRCRRKQNKLALVLTPTDFSYSLFKSLKLPDRNEFIGLAWKKPPYWTNKLDLTHHPQAARQVKRSPAIGLSDRLSVQGRGLRASLSINFLLTAA